MNNSTKLLTLLSTICLAFVSGNAFASDPSYSNANADDLAALKEGVKGTEWKAGALGGLIITSGNSSTRTVTAGATASRKEGNNKLSLAIDGSYVRTGLYEVIDSNGNNTVDDKEFVRKGQTTSKALSAKARYDRFLSEKDAIYASGQALTDKPAGKNFISGGQIGYSRTAFKSDKHSLVVEAGYDLSYEVPFVGDGYLNHSLRAFAGYQSKLSEDTGFDATIEALSNINELDSVPTADRFEDTRVNGTISLTTKLFKDISFRFGFGAKYDNSPSLLPQLPGQPAFTDGFSPQAQELDTKTEATLIINFL